MIADLELTETVQDYLIDHARELSVDARWNIKEAMLQIQNDPECGDDVVESLGNQKTFEIEIDRGVSLILFYRLQHSSRAAKVTIWKAKFRLTMRSRGPRVRFV